MSRWATRRLKLFAVLLTMVSAASVAKAELRYRVALLRPHAPDEVTTEALARVSGELTAAGFEVRVVDQTFGEDPRTEVESAARDQDPIAAFAIVRTASDDGSRGTAEIWVSDRITGKTVVQRTHYDREGSGRGAAVLAVQAVELLKASLVGLWIAPGQPRATDSVDASTRQTPSPPPSSEKRYVTSGLVVEGGLALLHSFQDLGPVWAPIVKASYGGAHGLGVRLSASGFGTSVDRTASAGSARLDQQIGMVELLISLRPERRLQLLVSAGVGAHHLDLEGTGSAPYLGRSPEAWSFLTAVGAGLAVRLLPRLAVVVEVHALVTWPPTDVFIGADKVGRIGWPSLLADAGVMGAF
jgi:hypothetical protein